MRRGLLAIGATIAGLVALLSFKSHAPGGSPAATANTGLSAPTPAPAGSVHGSAAPGAAPRGSAAAAAGTPLTLTGAPIQTRFGTMQVQVTLVGHKITKVTVLQQTDLGAFSSQIDARAIPLLKQETLAAQSAKIDAVSGASYTSAGYIQSLQSALDEA